MSLVKEFQSFVIGNLAASSDVKESLNDLFEALDSDLDQVYVMSSDVEYSIKAFNESLINTNPAKDEEESEEDNDNEEETDIPDVISEPESTEQNDEDSDDSVEEEVEEVVTEDDIDSEEVEELEEVETPENENED